MIKVAGVHTDDVPPTRQGSEFQLSKSLTVIFRSDRSIRDLRTGAIANSRRYVSRRSCPQIALEQHSLPLNLNSRDAYYAPSWECVRRGVVLFCKPWEAR
jgi:hypothetical protein